MFYTPHINTHPTKLFTVCIYLWISCVFTCGDLPLNGELHEGKDRACLLHHPIPSSLLSTWLTTGDWYTSYWMNEGFEAVVLNPISHQSHLDSFKIHDLQPQLLKFWFNWSRLRSWYEQFLKAPRDSPRQFELRPLQSQRSSRPVISKLSTSFYSKNIFFTITP